MREGERERESVCVCVCVRERERERERKEEGGKHLLRVAIHLPHDLRNLSAQWQKIELQFLSPIALAGIQTANKHTHTHMQMCQRRNSGYCRI